MKPFRPLAIVGQACVLPEASSPAALWELVSSSRCVVRDVPPHRFRIDPALVAGTTASSVDRTYSSRGGYVTAAVAAPPALAGLDPLFAWVLDAARTALVDAGLDGVRSARIGAVFGNLSFPTESMTLLGEQTALGDARRRLGAPWSVDVDPRDRFMSGLPAHLLARELDLRAGAFALDAACASSLYAVRLAANALDEGRADVMLAGAVNRADSLFLHVGFCALQALSAAGVPRPFDKRADGLVPAEGCGMVALMRLDDAVAQNRTIHGVIRGVGLSNDGRSKNLLAPSSEGQVRAIRSAWAGAGLDVAGADYIECHATGTPMGDRVEVESVAEAFATSSRTEPLPLGSLKANLGHLITAAGVAGLIKVTQALAHEELPPSINAEEPLAIFADGEKKLRVQRERAPWKAHDGRPRRAGVSAFGFGGNNAHVVVEEHRPARVRVAVAPPVHTSANIEAAGGPSDAVHTGRVAVVAVGLRLGAARDLAGLLEIAAASPAARSQANTGVSAPVDVVLEGVRFPPKDLEGALAQQLLAFEAARDAADAADGLLASLDRARVGVFIGMGTDMRVTTPGLRWRAPLIARRLGYAGDLSSSPSFVDALRDAAMAPMGAQGVLGSMPNIPANRLNVQLDARGPGFTVSAEEQSGLVALDVAADLLASDEIDAALVGAVDACRDPRHAQALAALRETAEAADGAVVFVVTSEERARAAGLPVLAWLAPCAPSSATGVAALSARESRARLGDTHAASGLFAVAEAMARAATVRGRAIRVEVDALAADPRCIDVVAGEDAVVGRVKGGAGAGAMTSSSRPAARAVPREEIAFLYGTAGLVAPGMGGELLRAFPDVAASLRADVGAEALARVLDGTRHPAGCLGDLAMASALMQISTRALRDVLGVRFGHTIGISLGESNALFASGAWRDLGPMLEDMESSRLFDELLWGSFTAARAYWRDHDRGALASSPAPPWKALSVRAPLAAIRDACAAAGCFVLVIHADDEAEIGGAPDAVDRATAALGAAAVEMPRMPAVHCALLEPARDAYRAMHRRKTFATDVRTWSHGVDGELSVGDGADDAVADAILAQASRTVDVPALLRRAVAAGVRVIVDVSPRGLAGTWAQRVLGDRCTVVSVDGTLASLRSAAEKLAAAGVPVDTARLDALAPSTRTGRVMTVPPTPYPKPLPPIPLVVERMEPPPPLPRVLPAAAEGAVPDAATVPTERGGARARETAPAPTAAPLPRPRRDDDGSDDGGDDAGAAALLAHREGALAAHQAMLAAMADGHAAFLAHRAAHVERVLALGDRDIIAAELLQPAHAQIDETGDEPQQTQAPLWDRAALEVLASGRIADVWGEAFAVQDGFRRQVRMPMPPLLLADRVMSIDAQPGVLERQRSIVTETDVRWDSWWLHEGRCPAGVLIETGQADLLLISYMGVDFENKGERVYRLLGCDLTYKAPLPLAGDTLRHDIHIDGYATHGDVRIFFFHSDTWGVPPSAAPDSAPQLLLSVREGQAGFFTDEELAHSGGVLWSPPLQRSPEIPSLPQVSKRRALGFEELRAFSEGDAFGCFGPGFEIARTHVRSPRIPSGRLLLLDRVTDLDVAGGYLRAELDLIEGGDAGPSRKWFFDGHFKDDPCMPGTIMFEGCLETLAVYLGACGFTLSRDGYRFEPAVDKVFKLRCRGQAVPSSRKLVYEVFVKRVIDGVEPAVVADILVTVDGLKSLFCDSVELKLAVDYPITSVPAYSTEDGVSPRTTHALLATGVGKPSDAFPALYAGFDDGRRVPRLPGPPYHFMSRVVAVEGPAPGALARNESAAGTVAVVEYDVPPDAWYLSRGAMPFAVLLEVALQPCGWVSSVVGSALTSSADLYYRNLDGTSRMHREVTRDTGTLVTRAELLKSSSSGGMIIQELRFSVTTAAGEPVYDGTTVFGFFPKDALARQVGVGTTDAERARLAERCAGFDVVDLRGRAIAGMDHGRLRMIDRVTGVWPTASKTGKARVRTEKDVDMRDWFFQAHFYQDPVQPGSLGIEAMVQALEWLAVHEGHASPDAHHFESLATGEPAVWKYRGQVTPAAKLVQVELDLVDVVDEGGGAVLLRADASLWVDGTKIYTADGLAVRARARR